MNRSILPLIVASPILAALSTSAYAAALAQDPHLLTPHFLKDASLTKHASTKIPTGEITLHESKSASVQAPAHLNFFADAGSGELSLTGNSDVDEDDADLVVSSGAVQLDTPIDLTAPINSISNTLPKVNFPVIGTSVPVNGTLLAGSFHEAFQFGNVGESQTAAPTASSVSAPESVSLSSAPVPEPSGAVLFALGLLAIGRTRARREA